MLPAGALGRFLAMPKKKLKASVPAPNPVQWNPDRGRYDVVVDGRLVGFHTRKGGAEAIRDREMKKSKP